IASPLLAWSSPAMILSSDDLPVPLGPTTPILAPWRNERVTLSRTTLSPWALRTLRSVKTYSAMVGPSLRGEPGPAEARVSARAGGRLGDRRRLGPLTPARHGRRLARGLRDHGRHLLVEVAGDGLGTRRLGEDAGAAAQVVTHVGRLDLEPGDLLALVVGPGPRRQASVHDDRVAPLHGVADPLGEGAPGGHGVPRGLAVDPLAVAADARGDADPQGGDADALDVAVADLAADPAVQGDVGVVHRSSLAREWTPASQPRDGDAQQQTAARCARTERRGAWGRDPAQRAMTTARPSPTAR